MPKKTTKQTKKPAKSVAKKAQRVAVAGGGADLSKRKSLRNA